MLTAIRMADPEGGALDDVVDLERWPLPPDPGAAERTSALRADLDRYGIASAPAFLRRGPVAALDSAFTELMPYADVRVDERSIYGRDGDDGLGSDPLCSTWIAGHITRDMIPPHSPAHRLYVSPAFKHFVARCLGVERVYEYADPLAGLVVTVVPPGGCYGWHYDTNEFVVTIAIGAAERGGRFEYVPDLRGPGEENPETARRVVGGQASDSVQSAEGAPGDLQLFRGRYSLHRVTPVEGGLPRLTLVLSYADRPGVIGPLDRTRRVYGRVTEAHLLAGSTRRSADGLVL